MVKRTRGVTLVEILLIVIIIGILSGLFSLSSSHATDKANETACANNRRTLRSAYIVAKTSDNSASFKKLIETIMADYLNAEKVELADSTAVYKKLCPGEGSYSISVKNSSQDIDVVCSKHSVNSAIEEILDIVKKLLNLDAVKEYFADPRRAAAGKTLDSTGPNFGPGVIEALCKELGIDSLNSSFCIERIAKGKDEFNVYYTDKNIADLKPGERCAVYMYDSKTGKIISGTVEIVTKTVTGSGGKPVTVNVFGVGENDKGGSTFKAD